MKKSLAKLKEILSEGLCNRCGSCSGICPVGVIEPDGDYYPDWRGREEECTDCGLCVSVCPGISFSFPEHSRMIFGREITAGDDHGFFLKAFLAYSTDPVIRRNSTSGGVTTQIPAYLLRAGRIKGAFTVAPDTVHAWKPRAFIARTEEDLLKGHLSKYPACSMNHLLRLIRDEHGPFVFTGLPCHVHGLRKTMSLDRALEEKIAVVVGLLCHSCMDHQIIRDIFDFYGIDERSVKRVEYRAGKLPGYIRAMGEDGKWIYLPYPHLGPDRYRPDAKECLTFFFKFYSPPRCRLCIDATSEFADIAIGDPWIKGWQGMDKLRQGYNLVLARTERGLGLLEEMGEAGMIVLEPFSMERALVSHGPMIKAKRLKSFYRIEAAKRKKQARPDYDMAKQLSAGEKLRARFHLVLYFASDMPRLRRLIFGFLLSRPGRIVVGLSFFRRHVLLALWERVKERLRKRSSTG